MKKIEWNPHVPKRQTLEIKSLVAQFVVLKHTVLKGKLDSPLI